MRLSLCSTPFPYTTLFRSRRHESAAFCMYLSGSQKQFMENKCIQTLHDVAIFNLEFFFFFDAEAASFVKGQAYRSEEHTSELQSHSDLVCRLLLEKKKMHT